jgi:FtsP/CotA-like multicopper oxidase with cupredoxin domain
MQALYDGNKGDKGLPNAALKGLLKGDLTPWRGMPDLKDEPVTSQLQKVNFVIGNSSNVPECTNIPANTTVFYVNCHSYDPDRIDFTRQVGSTDNWQLTADAGFAEPHIYHIHVNPFEVMDVIETTTGKSIFGPNGECLVKPDELGLQNQYCGMWHTFKDTVFVQDGYQVMIRTRYDRYIGEFVIHCHILDHEDSGMMTNIQIVPDASAVGGGLGMPGMKHTQIPQ